jgi:uncharacterized membrane protein
MSIRKFGMLASLISGSFLLFFLPVFFRNNAGLASFSFISRKFFSHVCLQIPEHTFIYHNFVFPVCARCTGIYAGLFLGALSVALNLFPHVFFSQKHSIFLFALPICIHVAITFLHLSGYSLWIACLTGIIFGYSVFPFIATHLSESNFITNES